MGLPFRRAFRSFSWINTNMLLKNHNKDLLRISKNRHAPYWFHFMLLQNFIQFLSLLVVKVEVLALRHGFRSHHFGNCRPIPTILEEAWNRKMSSEDESDKCEPPWPQFFINVTTLIIILQRTLMWPIYKNPDGSSTGVSVRAGICEHPLMHPSHHGTPLVCVT